MVRTSIISSHTRRSSWTTTAKTSELGRILVLQGRYRSSIDTVFAAEEGVMMVALALIPLIDLHHVLLAAAIRMLLLLSACI